MQAQEQGRQWVIPQTVKLFFNPNFKVIRHCNQLRKSKKLNKNFQIQELQLHNLQLLIQI